MVISSFCTQIRGIATWIGKSPWNDDKQKKKARWGGASPIPKVEPPLVSSKSGVSKTSRIFIHRIYSKPTITLKQAIVIAYVCV